MNCKYLLVLAGLLGVPALFAGQARADITAVTFTSADSYANNSNNPTWMGYSFTPTQNLTLTALGYFYSEPGGTPSANPTLHAVTIYSGDWITASSSYPAAPNATVVATAEVDTSTVSGGQYAWTTLGTPVTLLAGTTYTLSANANPNANNPNAPQADAFVPVTFTGLSIDSNIGYISASSGDHEGFPAADGSNPLYELSSYNATTHYSYSLGANVTTDANYDPTFVGYFNGNFQYTVAGVPEPVSLGILGLGAAGLLLRRRK